MESDLNIEGSKYIYDWFGYWPSFHDAEIISISLQRTSSDDEQGPSVIALVHAFEMTSEITETGHYKLIKHCVIELEFVSAGNLSLNGFNHQNAVYGIEFSRSTNDLGQPAILVEFDPAHGVEMSLTCIKVKVKSVKPGKPANGVYA